MRRLILALSLLLAPALAQAATCTFSAGYSQWSAVATITGAGQTGCGTPAVTDTFVIPAGAEVIVTGNPGLTTGSIQNGGTLRVGPGVTLSPGVSLTQAAATGVLDVRGSVVYEGRISAPITWGAYGTTTGATITLPDDVSSIVATGDYIVYGDDDAPAPSTEIKGAVQVSPGPPTEGVYRPSYNKWAWYPYKTASVSTNTLVYLYDWLGQTGYTLSGTPYVGKRGPGLGGAVATVASATRMNYGWHTDLAFTETTSDPVTTTMDLASQYVEIVTPAACAGRMAKIMYSTNGGGSGTDHIIVAGDLTAPMPGSTAACTPQTVQIHFGARPGDLVRIVRPATIDGWNGSAAKSYLKLSGGKFQMKWSRLVRLASADPSSAAIFGTSNTAAMRCIVCVVNESASVSPLAGSYIRDSEIAYMDQDTAGDDTAALLVSGGKLGTESLRFTDNLDLTGISFDRINVHDPFSTGSTHGMHIWTSAIKGSRDSFTRLRVERLTDQGFSGNYAMLGLTTPPTYGIKEALIYEINPGTGRSSNGIKFAAKNWADLAGGITGAGFFSDVVVIGAGDLNIDSTEYGDVFQRIVIGGGWDSTAGGSVWFTDYNIVGTGTMPDFASSTYPVRVIDSVIPSFGPMTSLSRWKIGGDLINSILTTNHTGNSAIYSIHSVSGSFLDEGNGYTPASSGYFLWAANTTEQHNIDKLSITDSVLRSVYGTRLCSNQPAVTKLQSVNLTRAWWVGAGNAHSDEGNKGLIEGSAGSASCGSTSFSSAVNVSGLIFSTTTPLYGIGANANSSTGASYTNVFQNSTQAKDSQPVCGTTPSATCNVYTALYPRPADSGRLRQFVGTADAYDAFKDSKPRTLGIQTFGPAHAMLGDFVLSQIENWSSKDLVKPVTGGGGGLPRAY